MQLLSDAAERLWYRIITAVDDFGRMEADPEVVFTTCFQRQPKGWTVQKVASCLDELSMKAPEGDKPMVCIYRVGNRPYLQILSAEMHIYQRAKESKYPAPTQEQINQQLTNSCPQMPVDARTCAQIPSYPESRTPNSESRIPNPESRTPDDALSRFELEFWKPFPSRKGKKLLKDTAKKRFLALSPEDQRLCCAAVKAYARYCQEANRLPKDPPRFINGQDGELWREFIPAATKQAPDRPLPVVRQPVGDPPSLQTLRGPTSDEAMAIAQFTQRFGQGGPTA